MEGTKSSPSPPPAPNPEALHQDSEDDRIRALVGLLQESNIFFFCWQKSGQTFSLFCCLGFLGGVFLWRIMERVELNRGYQITTSSRKFSLWCLTHTALSMVWLNCLPYLDLGQKFFQVKLTGNLIFSFLYHSVSCPLNTVFCVQKEFLIEPYTCR